MITLKIQDSGQQPVTDAVIDLVAFHRALAGAPIPVELVEVGEGVYSGKLQVAKSGLWQFEGQATRDGDVFLIKDQQLLK